MICEFCGDLVDEYPACSEQSVSPIGNVYYCTRSREHVGYHVACSSNMGHALQGWDEKGAVLWVSHALYEWSQKHRGVLH